MRLEQNNIIDELQAPSKKNEIQSALSQQERIKFHADTSLSSVQSPSLNRFRTFVESILPSEKAEITMNLLKFPLPTNSLTDKVFVKLSKIFDGRNPAFNYQFDNTQEKDDWEWYRQERLHEPEVWSGTAWEYFKTEINCVMVVDMPLVEREADRYPQPYFYFVPISSVVSYKVNDSTGNMDWIIYHSNGNVIVIDGVSYRVFEYDHDRRVLGKLISDNPHGLDFCPARFFWNEPLSLDNPDVKKSPLSKVLSELDWYLFKELGKRHLETYASYPIYSAYEEECDYTDKDGNTCNHGYLQSPDGRFVTDVNGEPKICPVCHGKKQLAGAGTFITVPIPDEGQPDLRNPVSILSVDSESLKYNKMSVEEMKQSIVDSCVGVDNSILNELSVTDKQVDASFESQDVVLNRIKKGFEEAQRFIDSTCCMLRYGKSFLFASVNYGNEFYTLTTEVLQKRYASAKAGGATLSELDALRQQMLETEYRHNPTMLQRMLILTDLEPFCHSDREECMAMYEKGLITQEELMVKLNFSNYIRRFERENGNIIEFGTAIPYSNKIDNIYNTLKNYAAERTKSIEKKGLPSAEGRGEGGSLQN